MSAFSESLWKYLSNLHVAAYRLLKGRIVGPRLILITTTGRKSGRKRTLPLMAGHDGSDYILVASKGGAPEHPAWYLNLKANPAVTVEDHGRVIACEAHVVTDEAEYQRLWTLMATLNPGYNSYQKRTKRIIPVVLLKPLNV